MLSSIIRSTLAGFPEFANHMLKIELYPLDLSVRLPISSKFNDLLRQAI